MSQGGDESQEKTEEPTTEKLRKAREKGEIAKSDDVAVAAAYLGLLTAVTLWGGAAAQGVGEALLTFHAAPEILVERALGPGGPGLMMQMLMPALSAVAPVILLPGLFALVALLAQQAIVFSTSKIEPKLSKISPIEGAKKKFGLTGMVEFLKSAVKLIAVCCVLAWMVTAGMDRFIAAAFAPGDALPGLLQEEAMRMLTAATVVMLGIGTLDYLWRVYDHKRKQMMSMKEVKDESKESEGDPHMKQSRRQRGREIAMNQMMQAVPKADVVIVNPTHYAVALKWSRAPGAAPVCVAKGVDEVALTIREIAEKEGVPVREDPPTARALYAATEIDQEIDPDHYRAVAAAIQFADKMRQKAAAR